MRADHVIALLRVELRRAVPAFARGLLPLAAMLVLLLIDRKRAVATISFVGFTALAIGAGVVPMLVFQDRKRGVLAFLCGLPTDGRTLAAARFLAIACLTLPCVLLTAVALSGGLGGHLPFAQRMISGAAIAFGAWGAALVIGCVATALLSRYSLASVVIFPATIIIVGTSIGQVVCRRWPAHFARPNWFTAAATPALLVELAAAAVVLGAALIALAFEATARRFAALPPERLVP